MLNNQSPDHIPPETNSADQSICALVLTASPSIL